MNIKIDKKRGKVVEIEGKPFETINVDLDKHLSEIEISFKNEKDFELLKNEKQVEIKIYNKFFTCNLIGDIFYNYYENSCREKKYCLLYRFELVFRHETLDDILE